MYKEDDGQISLAEFMTPFGKLDSENRWVKMANLIPWPKFEEKYKKQFCTDNGAPAIKFRAAMGALIIKQLTGRSDEEVIEDILESPYKQYFIGLHEFTLHPPFSQSSMTNFRKYISAEMIKELNDELFRRMKEDSVNRPPSGAGGSNNETPYAKPSEGTHQPHCESSRESTVETAIPNKGTLILDATCAPADIAYPTDLNLLNKSREKLEGMIDTLYPHSALRLKPRTYRRVARKEYLRYIFQKKPDYEKLREAIEQQLKYVKRNLKHVYNLTKMVPISRLSGNQQKWLETIRLIYEQQLFMYENKVNTVENRIVSISQPHVRPIKRGKAKASYEFGAKVSISLIDGYSFVDRLDWDSYNEEAQLIQAVESYKKHNGFYPERVLADQIYRSKGNRLYCKKLGIRLSGPPLGRPSATTGAEQKRQQTKDSADRNAVEGKFGEGKQKYGLGRIMARIKESSETVINLAFLCMNIKRWLRCVLSFLSFLSFFAKSRFIGFVSLFQWYNPTFITEFWQFRVFG